MYIYKKDLDDLEQRLVITFDKDYSNEPDTLKEIDLTVEDAFFEWLHYDEVYDEEDQSEVENMNPARFIAERLDMEGYYNSDYALEDLEIE